VARLQEFIKTKQENPLQPYGSKDYKFLGKGPIAKNLPKMRHAGMTWDVSLFYEVEGKDPHILKLYGFFTHDESGTGTPANIRRQKQLVTKLSNQTFQ